MLRLVLPSLLLLAPKTSAPAAPADADLAKVVSAIQKRYDKTTDLSASFTQTTTQPTFNKKTTASGDLRLKKPGKMRFDYRKPDVEMWLANGSKMYWYQPEEKRVLTQNAHDTQLPAAVSFLMGKGKLQDEFNVSFAKPGDVPSAAAGDWTLSLEPKQGAGYKSIYFVVDPASHLVKQSILVNAQGTTTAFTFTDIKTNTKVPDAAFVWTPPAGVKEVPVK